jgi:hypothetical protein
VVRDCDTALYAASAKERATACSSTVARPRCNSKVRSDGNARAQRRTLGIPTECLAAFRRPLLRPNWRPLSFWRGVASMELSLVADCSPPLEAARLTLVADHSR